MKRFKKSVSAILAFALILAMFTVTSNSVSAETIKGNVNTNDTLINAKDILSLRQYLAGILTASSEKFDIIAADVSGDTKVDTKDVFILRQYVAGKINKFPEVTADLPIGVDNTYKSQLLDETKVNDVKYTIAINQCGYSPNTTKIIQLVEEDNIYTPAVVQSPISKKVCYIVDVNTNTSVASFTSEKRSAYDRAGVYAADLDLTSFNTPGTYRIYSPIGYSYPFEIKNNAYQEATDEMVKSLYYNRCGCALDENIVAKGYARPACHIEASGSGLTVKGKEVIICDTYDASKGAFVPNKDANQNIIKYAASDFYGGLHDAGDYGRYTTPAAQVVADLLYAYEMNPTAYTTDLIQDNPGENLPDILDEARWEADFLTRMQAPSGGIYFKICTDTFASACWSKPEADKSFNGTIDGKSDAGFKVQHVNMESTGACAGALASAAYAFKTIDPDFSAKCLASAEKAYNYFVANVESNSAEMKARKASASGLDSPSVGGGPYGGSNCRPAGWYMACALYRATGKAVYRDYIKYCVDNGYAYGTDTSCNNHGGFGTACYLLTQKNTPSVTVDSTIAASCLEAINKAATSCKNRTEDEKFGSVIGDGKYTWGSNGAMNVMLKNCAFAQYIDGSVDYTDTIRRNISFFLGANPRGFCLVTGLGSKASKNIHHFPSVIIQHDTGVPCVKGFMVGGYCEEGSPYYYADVNGDCKTNEICVYWNSSPIATFGTVVAKDIADAK